MFWSPTAVTCFSFVAFKPKKSSKFLDTIPNSVLHNPTIVQLIRLWIIFLFPKIKKKNFHLWSLVCMPGYRDRIFISKYQFILSFRHIKKYAVTAQALSLIRKYAVTA